MKLTLTSIAILVLLTSCGTQPTQPTVAAGSTVQTPTIHSADTLAPTVAHMPNPASLFCEQQGYRLEIRTAADGSQSGVCSFPDGSECDEWVYFRAECGPSILAVPPAALTSIPTPLPIDPADYRAGGLTLIRSTIFRSCCPMAGS